MSGGRLTPKVRLPEGVGRPAYDRDLLEPGILHIGLGAFHRAHQAVYTDAALAEAFGPWGIEAVSLRSTGTVEALRAQSGLYSVLVREGEETHSQVVGAIVGMHAGRAGPETVLQRLADERTRVVTLTVTEKAYGIDPASGELDAAHPDVAHDLATPRRPRGVIGYLVEGLARRRERKVPPFTVLCCDNLPTNGQLVERLVKRFAQECDSDLAKWIADNVAFPSSMVDRIVPAPTTKTLEDAERLLGCRDEAAVETEPFMQWVIEDRFSAGHPAWDAAGALFVPEVAPYEHMKLRLLNGAHSLIAYLGQNRDIAYVRDVMAVEDHRNLVARLMQQAARTLPPVPGIDIGDYMESLIERFSNRAIAHSTKQIAMDGTQKLPQRLLLPAAKAMAEGSDSSAFARAVAEWIAFCCRASGIDDPREKELRSAASQAMSAGGGPAARPFVQLNGLFPPVLQASDAWNTILQSQLDRVWSELERASI